MYYLFCSVIQFCNIWNFIYLYGISYYHDSLPTNTADSMPIPSTTTTTTTTSDYEKLNRNHIDYIKCPIISELTITIEYCPSRCIITKDVTLRNSLSHNKNSTYMSRVGGGFLSYRFLVLIHNLVRKS